MHTVLAVLDTGAGPNLVRESLLPKDWRRLAIRQDAYPVIRDANGRKLNVEGVVQLNLDIGGQSFRVRFLVCKNLAVKAILGCDFIRRCVQGIFPQTNQVILQDGGSVALYAPKKRLCAIVCSLEAREEGRPRRQTAPRRRRHIKLATAVEVPPLSEAVIRVTASVSGIHRVEPVPNLMRKHKITIPYGVIDPAPGCEFLMTVANFSRRRRRIPKGTIIGRVVGRPRYLICPLETTRATDGVEAPKTGSNLDPEVPSWAQDVSLDHLDKVTKSKLLGLLRQYSEICDGRLGTLKGVYHRIDLLPGSTPIFQQPYRAGPEARKAEEAEVQRMLEAEVIAPSMSEWASPVILVPKPDKSLRFCVDYRKLNSITKRDSYPMPRMDECIDSLGSANIFSTLDCNSGYWQLPIAERDQDKTTFTCHAGSYKFIRMPFGLRNAPATFQRAMDIILSRVRWKHCIVYLDDIIVFSDTRDDHLSHLDEVLRLLKEAGVTLRLAKCDFFKAEVKYLGHVIRPGRLGMLRKNVEAIEKAEVPKTKTQMRSFLGMCNVYRRFIKGYARIAHPLSRRTSKDFPETWDDLSEEEITAFKTLKRCLVTAPILALPREGHPYTLDTDASAYQVGCCLLQEQPDGNLLPVGYWSRSLTPAEKNYSSTEKECLAIVWATLHLRPYLERSRFTIRTDHDALKWLLNLRDPRGRLARWGLRLQEFDFDIQYRPGSSHALADGPSRLSTAGLDKSHLNDEIPCLPRGSKHLFRPQTKDERSETPSPQGEITSALLVRNDELRLPISVDEMLSEQSCDEYCQWARRQMDLSTESPFAIDQHGVLIRRSPLDGTLQVVVPESLRRRVLDIAHHPPISAHPGRSRMYQTLRRDFYWPSMTVDIHFTVDSCDACARNRIKDQRNVYPMKLFPATNPLEYVAMDILGPLPRTKHGKRFILVVTDRFTKLTKTESLRTITSLSVAKAFCRIWVYNYGTPKVLLTDNGTQFTSRFFLNVCRILGVKKVFTTAYHPQANGQAERFNRTILAQLRDYVSESQRDWDEWLEPLTYAYNMQVHRSTGTTPFDLVLSRHPPSLLMEEDLREHIPRESSPTRSERISSVKNQFLTRLEMLMQKARANLNRTQLRYKRNFDARIRRRLQNLKVGSFVYREIAEHPPGVNPKLTSQVEGPFEVLSNEWPVIVIDDNGRAVRINANRLVRAPTPRRAGNPVTQDGSSGSQPANSNQESARLPGGRRSLERDVGREQADFAPESPSEGRLDAPDEDEIELWHEANMPDNFPEWDFSPQRRDETDRPSGGRYPLRDRTRAGARMTRPTTERGSMYPYEDQGLASGASTDGRQSAALRSHRSIRQSTMDLREYEIEKVLDAGVADDGSILFRIRWKGYGPRDDTWEPEENLPQEIARAARQRLNLAP